ncbi:MAG: RNA methyltransferase [Bacteroidetes bacterium]|nr:RNA methyltransferase [Bacteroidota bacterium]
MLTNAIIKQIKSLHSKSERKTTGLFISEGDKICKEIISSNLNIKGIYALQQWIDENKKPLEHFSNVNIISEKDLSRISGQKTPNKVLIVAEIPKPSIQDLIISNNITIVLENIQDAGNLGTIIRTADWFGIKNIVCSPDTVELFNPKVVQSSMGSILRTKVIYTPLEEFFNTISKEIKVYGAFLKGESIKDINFPSECILVFGNESNGISEKLLKFITNKTTIPSFLANDYDSGAESLNVAIAVATYLSRIKLS